MEAGFAFRRHEFTRRLKGISLDSPLVAPSTLIQYRYRFHRPTGGEVVLSVRAAPGKEPLVDDTTDPDRIPYWQVIWDAAPALAQWLAANLELQGIPVLELGCGAGLVGLTAAALGARVTQTDLFSEAVELARANALLNGLTGIRFTTADWTHWPLRERWPIILGSDLTYERASHGPLLDVLDRALAPGGGAYLADPGRPMTEAFMAEARTQGWHLRSHELPGNPAYRIVRLDRCDAPH